MSVDSGNFHALQRRPDMGKTQLLLSSSSSIFHGVGPFVDPFRSHASRSLFNSLAPEFPLKV